MEDKVRFYQKLGGRKAFIALLFFTVTLILYILQGLEWLNLDITFSQLINFWKWDAGIFVFGNVMSKGTGAVTEYFKSKSGSK